MSISSPRQASSTVQARLRWRFSRFHSLAPHPNGRGLAANGAIGDNCFVAAPMASPVSCCAGWSNGAQWGPPMAGADTAFPAEARAVAQGHQRELLAASRSRRMASMRRKQTVTACSRRAIRGQRNRRRGMRWNLYGIASSALEEASLAIEAPAPLIATAPRFARHLREHRLLCCRSSFSTQCLTSSRRGPAGNLRISTPGFQPWPSMDCTGPYGSQSRSHGRVGVGV